MKSTVLVIVLVSAACGTTSHPQHSTDAGAGGSGGIDACYPKGCSAETASCGTVGDDGCGHPLTCGDCIGPATCGGDGVDHVCAIATADRTCRDGWCWEAPSPIPISTAAMAAVSPTDVWAVGGRGALEHFDGTTWAFVDAGTTADLYGVWMASATDGWIVGAAGTMLRWNGTAWHAVASGTTAALYAVHGSSPTAVWAVGAGVTRKWNGSAVVAGATTSPTLYGVFAATNGSVVAIDSTRGYALSGGAWTAEIGFSTTFTSSYFAGLAGSGNTAYAVGLNHDELGPDSGLAYRWDGTGWTQVDVGVAEMFGAFTDGSEVYGVRASEIIAMADQTTVAQAPSADVKLTRAVGAGGDVFVPVGGELPWHRSAATGTWTRASEFGWDIGLHEIGALASGDVWFGGTATPPDPQSTRGLGVLRWNHGLVPLDVAQSAGDETDAIAGASNADAWVVTEQTAAQASYPVVAWHALNGAVQGGSSPFAHVNAMHVDGDDVLLFADDGIEARDPTIGSRGWKAVPLATGVAWRAVAALPTTDLVIVGNTPAPAGHVALRTAGAWAEIAAPAIGSLCGVAATAATDVWAAGYDADATGAPVGKVAHWNGAAWTVTALPGAARLCTIAIDSGGAVWTSGAGSPVYERAAGGSTWTSSQPLFVGSVRALRQVGSDLWLVGDHGAILRRQ